MKIQKTLHIFYLNVDTLENRGLNFRETREFHPLNLKKLMYGNETLSTEKSSLIFNAVLQYIKEYKIF